MLDPIQIQECIAEGGLFALAIPPAAMAALAMLGLWLLLSLVRELKQRADLGRIRDLVIEGSLGQAILVADQRSKDDVLAVVRSGIVTVQSDGRIEPALEKIRQEATYRFGGRPPVLKMMALIALAMLPAALAIGGIVYAEGVVRDAAAALPDEAERAALLSVARADPAFSCPVDLGVTGALALAFPALLIGLLETRRRSSSTRERAVDTAALYAEMATRVVDPAHRVYAQERDRRRSDR